MERYIVLGLCQQLRLLAVPVHFKFDQSLGHFDLRNHPHLQSEVESLPSSSTNSIWIEDQLCTFLTSQDHRSIWSTEHDTLKSSKAVPMGVRFLFHCHKSRRRCTGYLQAQNLPFNWSSEHCPRLLSLSICSWSYWTGHRWCPADLLWLRQNRCWWRHQR